MQGGDREDAGPRMAQTGPDGKITVGRCRWWGLHKFGVPIKMISLERGRDGEAGGGIRVSTLVKVAG